MWDILWKVTPASVLWGLGTAIGELPPYFVARAAREVRATSSSPQLCPRARALTRVGGQSGEKLKDLQELDELDEAQTLLDRCVLFAKQR